MSKVYKVSNIRQLIDLNDNAINFNLNFTVTSKDGKDFEIAITTQKEFDSGKPLEFQTVRKSLSGTVGSNSNIFQSFIMILRAEEETEVEVILNLERLPEKLPEMQTNNIKEEKKEEPKSSNMWKYIVIVCVLLILIGAGYYLFLFLKKNKNNYQPLQYTNSSINSSSTNSSTDTCSISNTKPPSNITNNTFKTPSYANTKKTFSYY